MKDISEIINNLSISLAAIVGGIWALWTFRQLRQKKLAELEERAMLLEIKEQAVVDINLSAKQFMGENDTRRFIHIEVELTNKGNRNTHLYSEEPVIEVFEFDTTKGILDKFDNGKGFNYVLRVENKNTFPFLIEVKNSGFYKCRFKVKLSNDEKKVAKESGQNDDELYWLNEQIIEIK